ncbi:MAG: RuBisCO large subunit C-terminal-like domain-containing protein, partial [Pseudomonadota bacterium]
HAHRNGWGALSRHPMLGFSYVAWSKFWRLAGADHLHVNGIRNKFCEPDESVIASARSLLTPLYPGDGQGCETMPVFSSGQWAGQAADTFAAIGTTDLIYACGGGIAGHPDGIEAGVTSIREAWAAARDGVPIAVAARESRPLARAIETFGGRT